jgi:hypothetical protein
VTRLAFMNRVNGAGPVKSRLENGAISWLRRLLRWSAIAILSQLLFPVPSLQGEQAKPGEYQVEAAYLYNFGKFIQWPPNVTGAKSDSFSICIFGQDPFGRALNATVAGGTIEGKGVVVKRITSASEAVACQILFISSSEDNRLGKILETLDKAAVLTVSDISQFSQRGGMIQFVQAANRIRFEVNLAATQNAGLTLSSELLKVAVTVRRNSTPGG